MLGTNSITGKTMKHKQADLITQYAIDAQNSKTPWEFYEWYSDKFDSWKQCKNLPDVLATIFRVRRKLDAPQFVTEKVCEWSQVEEGFAQNCNPQTEGYAGSVWAEYLFKKLVFCPTCGGKVVVKERMCELAGIEFPVPVQHTKELDKVHFLVDLTNELVVEKLPPEINNETWWNNLVQRTREGAEQQLAAMQAALKQAITSAK